MNLIRLLIIVAIIWLAYRMYQNWLVKKASTQKQQKNKPDIENMVQCSTCGVHIPEQEALKLGKQFFCCDAHKK